MTSPGFGFLESKLTAWSKQQSRQGPWASTAQVITPGAVGRHGAQCPRLLIAQIKL